MPVVPFVFHDHDHHDVILQASWWKQTQFIPINLPSKFLQLDACVARIWRHDRILLFVLLLVQNLSRTMVWKTSHTHQFWSWALPFLYITFDSEPIQHLRIEHLLYTKKTNVFSWQHSNGYLHPWSLTWNLKISFWKGNPIIEPSPRKAAAENVDQTSGDKFAKRRNFP